MNVEILTDVLMDEMLWLQGPGCMTTETKQRFKEPSASSVDLYHKSVSANENTGFTSNHNIEPLTFHPDYAYLNNVPVSCLARVCSVTTLHALLPVW